MLAVTVSGCVGSVVSDWETKLKKGSSELEIEISCEFGEIAADVISHVAFGRNHKEAMEVHLIQKELQYLVFSSLFNDVLSHISIFRYLPTKNNLKMWRLQRKVRSILINIIESRLAAKEATGYGNDMLGVILEACAPEKVQNPLMTIDEIIEECKTFYLAGHETTTQMLTWTMFLLSTHGEWQETLREEVLSECGNKIPTGDMLNKLKLVNMFILETQIIRPRLTNPEDSRIRYRAQRHQGA